MLKTCNAKAFGRTRRITTIDWGLKNGSNKNGNFNSYVILSKRYNQANIRRRPNFGLLLAHRLRRWPNSKTTLGPRLMFAGNSWNGKLIMLISNRNPASHMLPSRYHGYVEDITANPVTLSLCWFNVEPPSATMAQHWTNIGSVSRVCRDNKSYRTPVVGRVSTTYIRYSCYDRHVFLPPWS